MKVLAAILICGGMLIIGAYAFFTPPKWNLFRLRPGIAKLFSEKTNNRIPKVIGFFFMLCGVLCAFGMIGSAVYKI